MGHSAQQLVELPRPVPRLTDARLPDAEPAWLWQGQLPSLNGLRALSIILVVLSHLNFQPAAPFTSPWFTPLGAAGVEMFFVISGFLITLLLLREQRQHGTVSLKGFYLRRVCRIVPAYGAYLLVVFGLAAAGWIVVPATAWVRALTYTTSLLRGPGLVWDLGHTWSLSVEEHFYLVWPCLFLLLPTRKILVAALACVVLTPVLRLGLHVFLRDSHPAFGFYTPTRLDAIAVGCCLAFFATNASFRRITHLRPAGAMFALLAGTAALTLVCEWHAILGDVRLLSYCDLVLCDTVKPILMAGVVWLCVTTPTGFAGRVLNGRLLSWIGVLSYSIYLWQQLFLNPNRTHWVCAWPWNICFALAAALVSYYLIEKPFLALKERMTRAKPAVRTLPREAGPATETPAVPAPAHAA